MLHFKLRGFVFSTAHKLFFSGHSTQRVDAAIYPMTAQGLLVPSPSTL